VSKTRPRSRVRRALGTRKAAMKTDRRLVLEVVFVKKSPAATDRFVDGTRDRSAGDTRRRSLRFTTVR
jgi:hypothetical protein